MDIVYILLGVIFVLLLVLLFVVLIRINNKKIKGELEYISENYDISQFKNDALTTDSPDIYNYKLTAVMKAQQNKIAELQNQINKLQQNVEKSAEELEAERAKVREAVEKNNAPVVNIPLPEMKDEEITIIDDTIPTGTNENPSEVISIPGVNVPEEKIVDNGEEIEVVGSEELKEDGEEIEIPTSAIEKVTPPTSNTQPPLKITEVKVNTNPIGYANAKEKAFASITDGNTTINRDIKSTTPEQKNLSYKTEVLDLSEIKELMNNEKN